MRVKICVFDRATVCGDDLTLDGLEELGEMRVYETVPPAEVANVIGDAEAVLCNKTLITRAVLEACPRLRYVGLMATGVNNVDLAAARERGVRVTNIPGYSTAAVAQLVMANVLEFATRLSEYNASTARGDWTRATAFTYFPYPLTELEGKTMGIFGMGAIGSRVAGLAAAFGMRVIYTSRVKKDLPYAFVDRETLFRESDFLSLHCPLTAETEGLVNEKLLALMKPTACLINTARGGVIVEADVARALREGRIARFCADTLAREPQSPDCPLIGAPNCRLTPHIAWAPRETRRRLIGILIDNLRRFQAGEKQNAVV
ncbi:MAG: D-2-hydroxyacid dehydrogenase [Clostridia bacterium]|nr:D-2-hydroxyacid dehydrogenase [Clostridia bacterium]